MQCELKSRRITHPKFIGKDWGPRRPRKFGSITWPSFNGNAVLVGQSPSGRATIYVDGSLPRSALRNAQHLLADVDRIIRLNDVIFGTNQGSTNTILFALGGQIDGTGGADHMGCDFSSGGNIEVCVSYGQAPRCSALFEAELSECCMNNNLCGLSTGEGLSRWCASVACGNALGDFASGPSWVQAGMANWVDRTDQSDTNYPSIGCTVCFLSWIRSKGFFLPKIARTMVSLGDFGTLAQLYASLTGQPAKSAWPAFKAAIQAVPGGVRNDNPFPVGRFAHRRILTAA